MTIAGSSIRSALPQGQVTSTFYWACKVSQQQQPGFLMAVNSKTQLHDFCVKNKSRDPWPIL